MTVKSVDRTAVDGHILRRAIGMNIAMRRTDPEGAIRADATLVGQIVRAAYADDLPILREQDIDNHFTS